MRGRWTTGDEGAQYDAPFDEWRTHLEGTRSSTILDFALRDVTAFLLRFRDRHTPGQVKVANAMLTSTYGMAFNINPLQPHERLEDQIAVYYRHDSRQSVSHKEKPRQGFDMSDLVEEMLATGPSRTVADDILIKRLVIQLRGMVGIRAGDLSKMAFTNAFPASFDIDAPSNITIWFHDTKTASSGGGPIPHWDSIELQPLSAERLDAVRLEGNLNWPAQRAQTLVDCCCVVRTLYWYYQRAGPAIRHKSSEVVLHGKRVYNEHTLLWIKGFAAMTSITNESRLRFLASTTMNGYVMAHHISCVTSAMLDDGITRDANWVAHAWRGNALSTLRHVGHKDAAVAASFHRSEKTYERYYKMEVDSSFAFRLSHIIDLASFKALGPIETLLF